MAALGELIVFLIYAFIISLTVILLFVSIFKKSLILFILSMLSGIFLTYFTVNQWKNKRKDELENVGTYNLTNYPNCKSCRIILLDNNCFKVMSENKVVERGDWHFEQGGDYFIVFLNNRQNQLGSFPYEYDRYDVKVK